MTRNGCQWANVNMHAMLISPVQTTHAFKHPATHHKLVGCHSYLLSCEILSDRSWTITGCMPSIISSCLKCSLNSRLSCRQENDIRLLLVITIQ